MQPGPLGRGHRQRSRKPTRHQQAKVFLISGLFNELIDRLRGSGRSSRRSRGSKHQLFIRLHGPVAHSFKGIGGQGQQTAGLRSGQGFPVGIAPLNPPPGNFGVAPRGPKVGQGGSLGLGGLLALGRNAAHPPLRQGRFGQKGLPLFTAVRRRGRHQGQTMGHGGPAHLQRPSKVAPSITIGG